MTNINKLRALIRETVESVLRESDASEEAHKKGLEYGSFGRWKDPKTGKVVATSKDGKLVYSKAGDGPKTADRPNLFTRQSQPGNSVFDPHNMLNSVKKNPDASTDDLAVELEKSIEEYTYDMTKKLDTSSLASSLKWDMNPDVPFNAGDSSESGSPVWPIVSSMVKAAHRNLSATKSINGRDIHDPHRTRVNDAIDKVLETGDNLAYEMDTTELESMLEKRRQDWIVSQKKNKDAPKSMPGTYDRGSDDDDYAYDSRKNGDWD